MASSSVYGKGRTIGRGPSGRVRNFGAMLTPKLIAVEELLTADGADPTALYRCREELRTRGFMYSSAATGNIVSREAALIAVGTTESEVQNEAEELLAWLADL